MRTELVISASGGDTPVRPLVGTGPSESRGVYSVCLGHGGLCVPSTCTLVEGTLPSGQWQWFVASRSDIICSAKDFFASPGTWYPLSPILVLCPQPVTPSSSGVSVLRALRGAFCRMSQAFVECVQTSSNPNFASSYSGDFGPVTLGPRAPRCKMGPLQVIT